MSVLCAVGVFRKFGLSLSGVWELVRMLLPVLLPVVRLSTAIRHVFFKAVKRERSFEARDTAGAVLDSQRSLFVCVRCEK